LKCEFLYYTGIGASPGQEAGKQESVLARKFGRLVIRGFQAGGVWGMNDQYIQSSRLHLIPTLKKQPVFFDPYVNILADDPDQQRP
jgi:hypothetical protein